jgi:hypothetical protein
VTWTIAPAGQPRKTLIAARAAQTPWNETRVFYLGSTCPGLPRICLSGP